MRTRSTLLGLKSMVPGYPNPGGALEHRTTHPHWDVVRAMRAARERGGFRHWPQGHPPFASPEDRGTRSRAPSRLSASSTAGSRGIRRST